nr:hypothetical protein [Tanacetum cinerariifolium]
MSPENVAWDLSCTKIRCGFTGAVDSSARNELRAENEPSRQPKMSSNVARGHGGDGGGDDRPHPYQMPIGCGSCLGGRRVGRLHTRQETRNLKLKAITDKIGPVPIWFEFGDRETLMPLGDHAAHWANYLGELVREFLLHYPSWRQMPSERKAVVMTQFDLYPHMKSDRWPQIYAAIQQHLQKLYNGKKAALKERSHTFLPSQPQTYHTVIMGKMVPYEAFACPCGDRDVVLREPYKPKTHGKLYYACPRSKPCEDTFRCKIFYGKRNESVYWLVLLELQRL